MLEPVLDGPQNLSYVNFAPLFTPPAGRIGASLVLAPAMAVMDQMPELMQNSGYSALPDRLAARFGVPHYPYHSFLCERFFSYFAHLNNLTCGHY